MDRIDPIVFWIAVIGLISIVALIVALIVFLPPERKHNDHSCNAPCVVQLPKDTLEDEFWFDYGWLDDHHSIVTVYHCDKACKYER